MMLNFAGWSWLKITDLHNSNLEGPTGSIRTLWEHPEKDKKKKTKKINYFKTKLFVPTVTLGHCHSLLSFGHRRYWIRLSLAEKSCSELKFLHLGQNTSSGPLEMAQLTHFILSNFSQKNEASFLFFYIVSHLASSTTPHWNSVLLTTKTSENVWTIQRKTLWTRWNIT